MRLKRNLSQRLVAEMLGFDRSYLAKVEKGDRVLSKDLEEKLLIVYESIKVNESIEAKFDYLRIRFPTHDYKKIIREVLGMDVDYFDSEPTGLMGYKMKYFLGLIWVLNSEKESDRGVLIQLSGEGCRHYDSVLEERQEDYKDFLRRVKEHGGHATRVDVALDDFEGFFSISEMKKKIKKGEYNTRFKKGREIGDLDFSENESAGETVYFGTRSSNMHFCFYEKNYEIANRENIPLEDVEVKNRYEVRIMDGRAEKFLEEYMSSYDFGEVILGIISRQVTILEIDREGNESVWKKWLEFINGAEAIRLKMEPKKPTFAGKVAYVDRYVGRILKLIQSKDEIFGLTTLQDIIDRAKLRPKDEKLLDVEVAETAEFCDKTGILL